MQEVAGYPPTLVRNSSAGKEEVKLSNMEGVGISVNFLEVLNQTLLLSKK